MNKKFKKIVTLALALVLGITSVGSFTSVAQAQEPVQLVFWHGMGGANGEALQRIVDGFNESQDGIQVEAQYQGTYDETLTKLRSSASGSEVGADIVQVFEVGTQFMLDSGLTVPVQEYVDASGFDLSVLEENLLAYFTVDDTLHSMPFNNSTPLMYYNVDYFEQAGIETPPTSFEEIIEISPQLTENTDAAMGASISVYGWWIDQFFNKMQADLLNEGNGREGTPTASVFNENGNMENILTTWKEGVDSGATPNVGRTGGQPEFVSGQSAMTFASTANLRQILTEVDGRFEVGTAYFPGVTPEDEGGVSIGGASLWMIDSEDDAKKDATWEFIQYLVSPEVQAQWNADTGYFPVNTEAHNEQVFQDNLEQFPQFQTAIDQLHDSAPEDQGALAGVAQEMRQVFENELENVLNGESTPADAAAAMEEQVNSAIENYNTANQ